MCIFFFNDTATTEIYTLSLHDALPIYGVNKVYIGQIRNGKMNGEWTDWYESGEKSGEKTYKDGEFDGLWTEWHENGQKRYEQTYKNGKVISSKRWNEDGTEQ